MSDTSQEGLTHLHKEQLDPGQFSIPVLIKNLPYSFTGVIPEDPTEDFGWTIHIPSFAELTPRVNSDFRRSPEFDTFRTTGEIGKISVDGTKQTEAKLYLAKIHTYSEIPPSDSPYGNALGIGSFLMNQLVALADARKLSIGAYIQPEGRLSHEAMHAWFRRLGFEQDPSEGALLRRPQQLDASQPIVTILKKSPNIFT
jgi:hypothetical protein